MISNLAANFTSPYIGLFGFSYGFTIRNAILDSICSATNSFIQWSRQCLRRRNHWNYWECDAKEGLCIIENNINMGKVIFNGNTGNSFNLLFLGGIIGRLYLCSSHYSIVMNCASYGGIMYSGCAHIQTLEGLLENILDIQESVDKNTLNYWPNIR